MPFSESSLDTKRRPLMVVVAAIVCLAATTGVVPARFLGGGSGDSDRTAMAFDCPQPLSLTNSGFENPVIPTDFAFVPDADVPGWSTTASGGLFEFWRSGYQGVPAPQGNQFVELNAQSAGTVYQEVDTSTLQGQTLTYSFWHRGRYGNDTMAIEIRDADESQPNFQQQYTTGRSWAQYSGSYQVPVGQQTTVFSYRAVSGSTTGNFLDNVQFGTPPCTTDLSVTKTAGGDVYVPGEPITFTVEITNTGQFEGQFDLVGATLIDSVPAEITDVSWTCTASAGSACASPNGTGNQIDLTYDIVEGGTVAVEITGTAPAESPPPELTNTATVSAPDDVTDLDPSNNADSASIPIGEAALDLTKSSDYATDPPVVDELVTYTFVVSNPGTLPLTDVTVTDPMEGLSSIDCGGGVDVVPTLAPGESAVCTATYFISQEDVDAGTIENTATATATSPPGVDPPPPAQSSTTTPIEPEPAIAVEKSADTAGPVAVGDEISYSFVVTNEGNVTLGDVTVDDPLPGLSLVDCDGDGDAVVESLAPGASVTCTATYTVGQGDVDAGSVDNTVDATGTPPSGPALPPATDSLSIPASQSASLTLDKSAEPSGDVVVDDVIAYTFTVANTGTVTLSDVTVDDLLSDLSPVDCGGAPVVASLAPGASATCTASYTVTQDDVNRGGVQNDATATATPPAGVAPPAPATAALLVPADADPSISLDKSADAEDPVGPGDPITYTFAVANTSNVTLSDIEVTDHLAGMSDIDCGGGTNTIATLAPDETASCSGTYTVTQADVEAGSVTNAATVVGLLPSGDPVADEDAVTTPTTASPAIALAKSHDGIDDVDGNGADAGDTVAYTFTVTNTGDVPLSSTSVDDPLLGGPVSCAGGPLDSGQTRTCGATYVLTDADLDTTIENTATVTGTTSSGATVEATATATLRVPPACSAVDDSSMTTSTTISTTTTTASSVPATTSIPATTAVSSSLPTATDATAPVPTSETASTSETSETAETSATSATTTPTVPPSTTRASTPSSTSPSTTSSTTARISTPGPTPSAARAPGVTAPVGFVAPSALVAAPGADPCEPPSPTTVVPSTTSTSPSTTVAPPPASSTTPPTTPPSSTSPTTPPSPTSPTTPTDPADPPGPPVQPPAARPGGGATLPETGAGSIALVAIVALLAVGGGVGLVLIGRRRATAA